MAVPLVTKEEDNFRLTAAALEAAITPKTKLLVFPYPNNPTGAVMRREDLEPICRVLQKHKIYVLSDEIYSELTYGGVDHTSIAATTENRQQIIIAGKWIPTNMDIEKGYDVCVMNGGEISIPDNQTLSIKNNSRLFIYKGGKVSGEKNVQELDQRDSAGQYNYYAGFIELENIKICHKLDVSCYTTDIALKKPPVFKLDDRQ